MAIKTYSTDFNYTLTFEEDRILFKDLEQMEQRSYEVDPEDAEMLHRIANIAITDAAAILGKIEEIRIQVSSKDITFKRFEPKKLNQTLALILLTNDWREVYRTIREAKYHQIQEMCASKNPLSYFESLM